MLETASRKAVGRAYRQVYGVGMPATWYAAISDDFKLGSGDLWAEVDADVMRRARRWAREHHKSRAFGPWAIRRFVSDRSEAKIVAERKQQQQREAARKAQAERQAAEDQRRRELEYFDSLPADEQSILLEQAKERSSVKIPAVVRLTAEMLAWESRPDHKLHEAET